MKIIALAFVFSTSLSIKLNCLILGPLTFINKSTTIQIHHSGPVTVQCLGNFIHFSPVNLRCHPEDLRESSKKWSRELTRTNWISNLKLESKPLFSALLFYSFGEGQNVSASKLYIVFYFSSLLTNRLVEAISLH